jgi:phenylacetate-CoA oxygenase PaaJ subunit
MKPPKTPSWCGDLPWQIGYFLRKASLETWMKFRATNLMIGTLTLALIGASFGAWIGYQKIAGIKQRVPFRVVFEGSASGLRKGGSVNFSGIRVGEVVSLKLDNPRRVVALTMIDNSTPLRKDTLVGLEFQGLTGIAAISLTGGTVDGPPPPLDRDGIPVLTADPDALLNTQEKIRVALRNVAREDGTVVVTVTPTYSGCPATAMIAADIRRALMEAGIPHCRIETQLSPAWTTDWIAAEARERLRAYGIVPPGERAAKRAIDITGLRKREAVAIACPRCGSKRTQELSRFGSTPCKAQYRCDDCREPFEYFKPH